MLSKTTASTFKAFYISHLGSLSLGFLIYMTVNNNTYLQRLLRELMPMKHLAMPAHNKWSMNVNYHYYYILTRATTPRSLDHCRSPGIGTWYPPSVTGVGLGPEEGLGALGVSWGLGDTAGRKVVGAGFVEYRPSVVTTGVAPAWALTEAQQSRSTSRSGWRSHSPITQRKSARLAAKDRALPGNRGGWVRGITGRVARGRERLGAEGGAGPGRGRPQEAGMGAGLWDADLGQCEASGHLGLVNPVCRFQADCGTCLKNADFQVPPQGIVNQ